MTEDLIESHIGNALFVKGYGRENENKEGELANVK